MGASCCFLSIESWEVWVAKECEAHKPISEAANKMAAALATASERLQSGVADDASISGALTADTTLVRGTLFSGVGVKNAPHV